MNELSADDVQRVARLARLALTPAQLEESRVQLAAILRYVEQLRELDLTGVEPMSHPGDANNRLDDDTPREPMARDAFLRIAPATEGDYLKVPKVLGEES
ncbi:MAG: Asp-tRNA(Asn)/Glu-tRNA(Gln) amidotransferase subunit GatC [Planctomycetota bacterium]|nr:Asp-tRNA(Asn)/Glu-tRNA(Gln) amidotransferase subunit GatC [Planctomycetota bacterium]